MNTTPRWKTFLTEEDAIEKGKSGWYIGKSPQEIVEFQLYESRLCMPWDEFQAAVEQALGRPVQTIEFAAEGTRLLQQEFEEKIKHSAATTE